MSARMAPSLAKRFRSGRPCLDFAHTAATAYWQEPELIVDASSMQRWLGYVLAPATVLGEDRDVAGVHRLRAAILEVARARARGHQLDGDDIRIINAGATAATPVPQLDPEGMCATTSEVTVTAALSVLARDAIDLLTGPLADRIRVCAADDCEYLFVDASRPGTRRWCSMQRCGNLAKVRTHRTAHGHGSASAAGDERN